MKTMNRKKAQRKVNRVLRELNTNILRDPLWNGRFYVGQVSSTIHPYPDGSGLTGFVRCRFYDLKDGLTKDYWFELIDFTNDFVGHIYWTMNEFIVNESTAWTKGNPYDERLTVWRTNNSRPPEGKFCRQMPTNNLIFS